MTTHEPVRVPVIHVTHPPSRLAAARDLAIILVCVAILLGTLTELFVAARRPAPPAVAPASAPAEHVSL
jgi:hypothetical protein